MSFTSDDLTNLQNDIAHFSTFQGTTIGKAGLAYLQVS